VFAVNRSDVVAASAATVDGDFDLIVVTDTDTVTFLAAPTGISLSQGNRDLNADGTVDTALRTTFSGAVANAGGYEFQWLDSGGQTGYARVDSGAAFFSAVTTRSYQVRWRTLTWNNLPSRSTADSLSTGQPGAWSAYTSPVTPAATTGAPAAPSFPVATAEAGGFFLGWTPPTELDYAYTEVAVRTTPGTPTSSQIAAIMAKNGGALYHPWYGYDVYIYVRHFNTSGLSSSWALAAGPTRALPLVMARYNAGGTGGASVTVPSSAGRVAITGSWRCTSNTAGVTVTIGTTDIGPIDFIDKAVMSYTVVEEASGIKSLGKSAGSWGGAFLTVMETYDT
jgi:hypothetical protein